MCRRSRLIKIVPKALIKLLHSSLLTFHCRLKGGLARQEGLEPPTYCLEGSCSIQLSYWRISNGAGDGNRTRVSSLEGWCSTIELHPQIQTLSGSAIK